MIVEDVETLLFLIEAGCASLLMTPVREAAPAASDFLALRIEGVSAWRVALRAREIVEATGLEAFVKASSTTQLEVLVPVGNAPADAVHVLAALFARLLARVAEEAGVKVERLDAPIAPYAVVLPVVSGYEATATVSLPLSWNEVEGGVGQMSRLDNARARLAKGVVDPMRGMLAAPVHFAGAVEAIEKMVSAGGFQGGRA